ncbi:MAG: hypothetical protein QM765_52260 [Myxococcales bacterium]
MKQVTEKTRPMESAALRAPSPSPSGPSLTRAAVRTHWARPLGNSKT